ncbi:MAG: TetR/AcrR family transcriptional regulator [Saprospiraceae bacterium]
MVDMAKDTEQIILEVARKQFVQNGFSATRMQEIADEAGINKAMLHYYFRSKEKLYKEILVHTLNYMIPKFAGALEAPGSFWEKVERLIETYTVTLIAQPDIPFFIMSELSQQREGFVEELKKRASYFPAVQNFIIQIHTEMETGKIKKMAPLHLFLNIMGMTIFPFIAKPVFCTIFNFPDKDFESLMNERKEVILDFVKSALKV